jgi:hypothetical protein
MDYKLKYLKYKNKYIQLRNCNTLKLLRGGSGEIYSINLLWLNKNVQTSHTEQHYIFPFKNISIDINGKIFQIIDIDTILYIINIIEWATLNSMADINIWHDSTQHMIDETNELIHKIYNSDYSSLKLKFEIIQKIIDYKKKLLKVSKNKKEIDNILVDKLTTQYLTITHLTDGNITVEFTPSFIDIINEFNLLIAYNDQTKLITYGIQKSGSLPTDVKELHNLKYKSITILDRLSTPEKFTKNYRIHPEIPLIEHFGLKMDNSLSSFDSIPVYFKVDLVRLIILLQLVNENQDSYAIYADFDTMPLTKEQIFTEKSKDLLKKHGLVLPQDQIRIYENSFHILAGKNISENEYMQISIEKILVEFNIQKILHNYTIEQQSVYSNYEDMLLFYSAIIFDKPIQFHYPPAFDSFIFTENKDEKFKLQKIDLLNLDIKLVGQLYTSKFASKPDNTYAQRLFNFYMYKKTFDIIYPVSDDFADISPHSYNYHIKYINKLTDTF